jgi:hypothetical protein
MKPADLQDDGLFVGSAIPHVSPGGFMNNGLNRQISFRPKPKASAFSRP